MGITTSFLKGLTSALITGICYIVGSSVCGMFGLSDFVVGMISGLAAMGATCISLAVLRD